MLREIRFFPARTNEPKFLERNRSIRLRMGFLKTDPIVGQNVGQILWQPPPPITSSFEERLTTFACAFRPSSPTSNLFSRSTGR